MKYERKLEILGLIAVMTGGFLVRVWGISAVGLWHDEALSHYYSLHSVKWLIERCIHINHPPMFFLLLKGWLSVVPRFDQFWVEFLNVIFGTGTLLVFYHWIKQFVSVRWSLAMTGLLSFHPFHVHYSSELRMYCLALFGLTCAGYAFTRVMDESSPVFWSLWVLGSWVAIYSHSFSGILILPMIVLIGWEYIRNTGWRSWSLGTGIFLLGYSPWLVVLYRQVMEVSSQYWIPDFQWSQLLVLGYWLGGYLGPKAPGIYSLINSLAVCILFFFPLLWSLKRFTEPMVWQTWFIIGTPLSAVVAISVMGQSVLLYRTFLFILPWCLFLVVMGYRSLPEQVSTILFIGWLIFLCFVTFELKTRPPHQYAKQLPEWILKHRPHDAPVVHAGRFSFYPSLFYHRYAIPEFMYANKSKDHKRRADQDDISGWRQEGPVVIVYNRDLLYQAPLDEKPLNQWSRESGIVIKQKTWSTRTYELLILPRTS